MTFQELRFATPEHQIIDTPHSQSVDLIEILRVQDLNKRFQSIPKSIHEVSELKKEGLLELKLKAFIFRFSKKIKRPSKLRKNLGVFVYKLPKPIRNFVLSGLSGATIFPGSLKYPTAYSMDLGFGLATSKSPRVSIVIPVHNHWFTTLQCLKSLQKNTDSTPYEVILVDDASTDFTCDAAQNIRGIRIIKIKQNVGYLRATNLGAAYAQAEYIVLLNNDTEPISGWLDSLVSELDKDDRVAICGSTLIYPNGILQESGGQIFSGGNAWNLGRGKDPRNGMFQIRREVDYVSAASIIVRNSFWREVGGYDQQFAPAYCEDSDLCLTAWKLGYKVIVTPESWVIHHEGVSHGTSTSSGLKAFQAVNVKKFQVKWSKSLLNHWIDFGVPRIERTRNSKGIIFVADRQLPSISRDAGSVRTVQIMRHLISLNYHVILTALDDSTTEADVGYLQKIGIEVHINWEDALEAIRMRGIRVSHAWLFRSEVVDFFAKRIKLFLNNTKIIADLMDLDYESYSSGAKINPKQIKIAEGAERIILVSPTEAKLLEGVIQHRKVDVLWAEYPVKDHQYSFSGSDGLIFIGGFRHEPNLEGILWFTNSVLPHLRNLGFSAPIRVVGSGLSLTQIDLFSKAGIEVLGKRDNLEEIYGISRVAIVPLLSGRGLKGKIGEAMSYGVPVVTTSIGSEGFGFDPESFILISDDPVQFAHNIILAHENQSEWESMSAFGKRYCSERLNTNRMLESIRSIIEDPSHD